ncbi:MAG: IMPACT family protein [Oscillospiraceae bacterium]|jgi:uncharacterized YigZ family protein|nr:IMPACT family protein [Oscillospiraceae bacterium]
MNDFEYKTIESEVSAKFNEKRSRFISFAKPFSDQEKAFEFLKKIKKEHKSARHHAWAFRFWKNKQARYSDATEPKGTAGFLALQALERANLYDVMLVIVRYFGGVKLGKSSLSNAYKTTSEIALNLSNVVAVKLLNRLLILCDYKDYQAILKMISRFGGMVIGLSFSERVRLECSIEKKFSDSFRETILKFSKFQPKVQYLSESFSR